MESVPLSEFRVLYDGGRDAAAWRTWLLTGNPGRWGSAPGAALTRQTAADEQESLVIDYWRGLGWLLQWSALDAGSNRTRWCRFSVADRARLDRFEERDDLTYPVGCFVGPESAWWAVEDFLVGKPGPSSRVSWIDDREIRWPF